MTKKIDLASIFKNWDSPFISRRDLHRLTHGMINMKTLRNIDSLGADGIKNKFAFSSRRVAYPVADVIIWLEARYNKLNKPSTASTDVGGDNE